MPLSSVEKWRIVQPTSGTLRTSLMHATVMTVVDKDGTRFNIPGWFPLLRRPRARLWTFVLVFVSLVTVFYIWESKVTVNSGPPRRIKDSGSNILLVAYKRTGSTFLGRLLGARDDSFYWHEPLRFLRRNFYYRDDDLLCDYYKPTCIIQSVSDDLTRTDYLRIIREIFDCNFTSVATQNDMFLNMITNDHSTTWDGYRTCVDHRSPEDCLPEVERACRTARHRVVKVVRTDLAGITELFDSVPNLRVVQIFRDVRGTVNSRLRTHWYAEQFLKTAQNVEDDAKVLCSMIRSNLPKARKLLAEKDTFFKVLQYEDFSNLNHRLGHLLHWLGMDCAREHVSQSMSLLERPVNNVSQKDVSGNHPELYRTQLNWGTVHMIDTHCADIHSELGFKTFPNEQTFRDLSIPSLLYDALPFQI